MAFNDRVSINQLLKILDGYNHKELHIHHTWKPNYSSTRTHTPEQLNRNMKNYHVGKGWGDIAQHITTFPDGTVLLGRGFSKRPASIKGRNTGAFCVEQVGNFDFGKDIITVEQRNVILHLIAYFKRRGKGIVFHREYSSKTCPGTSLQKNGLIEASNYHLKYGELRRGITGTDVLAIQIKLGIGADGSFGPAMEKAVKNFQAKHGLKVDGIIGQNTFKVLRGESVGEKEEVVEVENITGFTDDREISAWSKDIIKSLKDQGVINGYEDGSFKPKQNITREEFAFALGKALEKLNK